MSFLSKIWAHIKELFTGLPQDLKTAIHIGVQVTSVFTVLVQSPVADIITALIPGDIDDRIKEYLRAKLPQILIDLRLVDVTLGLTDPHEIAANALKVFQDLDPQAKPAFLHSLSILIAQIAADGKLSWSDGVYLLQWYYENEYKTT